MDAYKLRDDFPILKRWVHGKPLVYLDNAASSQKPQAVIDAIEKVYTDSYSNIHRGVHALSQECTSAYEEAREKVQNFLNAAHSKEIIFVRNATEAINLVVSSYGRTNLSRGDEIVISAMEHHANIVPWQILCQQTGAVLRVAPMTDEGELQLDEYKKLLNDKTRFVSIVHISNALGTINPIRDIIAAAHDRGVPVLIDGAQSAPHTSIDVQELDCDFFVFSGHKLYGPSGIGVLYGKTEFLDSMPPYQGGGDMISYVSFEKTLYNDLPYKFEAGTPHIAGAIGLGAAIDYLTSIGLDSIAAYEQELLEYATRALAEIPEVRIIGAAKEKAAVISFLIGDIHPHDVGTILDQQGVAIRTGHHCAQPIMDRFGIPATARASLAFYNTREEIDALIAGIKKVIEVFG
ncbi:MAG: cysteine desulfurase [Candidatus Omnitrophica bacterium]|nr:cysteine desulfurase [Candidatus Omnitrophota bacterium]